MQARLDAQQQYLEGLSQGFDDHAKQMLTILQQLQAPEPLRVSPSFLELVDSSLEKFPYVYFAVFFFFALCCFLFPFVILVSFVFYFHFSIGFAWEILEFGIELTSDMIYHVTSQKYIVQIRAFKTLVFNC